MASVFFFFFSFRQASSNLCDSFTMVFRQNSSIFHWAVHQPITFSQLWSLTRHFKSAMENYGFICDTIFFTCMHTNCLAVKRNYYSRLQNYNYGWCAWRRSVSDIHCWLGIWTEPGQWFFSQYCNTVRTDLLHAQSASFVKETWPGAPGVKFQTSLLANRPTRFRPLKFRRVQMSRPSSPYVFNFVLRSGWEGLGPRLCKEKRKWCILLLYHLKSWLTTVTLQKYPIALLTLPEKLTNSSLSMKSPRK